MSSLLWQKQGVQIDAALQNFLAGEDVVLDRELMTYDLQASMVHAEGLQMIGILSAEEFAALHAALQRMQTEWQSGAWQLDAQFEDMHSAIEARLIAELGDTGRKIHTGRSRNDQVLVATRLYMRDRLQSLNDICAKIAGIALRRAHNEMLQPLPGYTHLQRAMVSSCGMWWAGWAEGFLDNRDLATDTLNWISSNPMGSASGYGVNLPLPREHCTQQLSFNRMQVSATYAQLSRGKFELQALQALSQALLDVRRLAWDLSLFASNEFDFTQLPAEYSTGSSLMPNKRNPDVIELLRASYARVAAAKVEIEQILSLPSGYHRDLQFSKAPLLRAFTQGLLALNLLPNLLEHLQWKPTSIERALEPSMLATDHAIDLARSGVPFREAYQRAAGDKPTALEDQWALNSLQARVSPGAAGQPMLGLLEARLQR